VDALSLDIDPDRFGADLAKRKLGGDRRLVVLACFQLRACPGESVEDFGLGAVALGRRAAFFGLCFLDRLLGLADSLVASRRVGFFTSRFGSSGSVS